MPRIRLSNGGGIAFGTAVIFLNCAILILLGLAIAFDVEPFSSGLIAHGHCYRWSLGLIWAHRSGDLAIAAAYFAIPIGCVLMGLWQRNLPAGSASLLILAAAFIFSCGVGHIIEPMMVYWPRYWLQALQKLVTASVSVPFALLFLRFVRQLRDVPTPEPIYEALRVLRDRVAAGTAVPNEVRALRGLRRFQERYSQALGGVRSEPETEPRQHDDAEER